VTRAAIDVLLPEADQAIAGIGAWLRDRNTTGE